MAKKVSKLFDWDFCLSLILITLGAVMSAVALELILIPNSMIDFIWWFSWYYYIFS